jgi:hypothetical protein
MQTPSQWSLTDSPEGLSLISCCTLTSNLPQNRRVLDLSVFREQKNLAEDFCRGPSRDGIAVKERGSMRERMPRLPMGAVWIRGAGASASGYAKGIHRETDSSLKPRP